MSRNLSRASEKAIVTQALYLMNVHALFRTLGANRSGLDQRQILKSRDEHGSNALLTHESTGALEVFFRQWKSPLTVALSIAALLSFFLGQPFDALVIAAVIITNVFVGFTQEWKAEEAFRELSRLVLVSARVRRRVRGRALVQSLPSDQIVVGDVILLSAGDVVPADARLLDVINFQTSEAALTGESLPVDKMAGTLRRLVGLAERVNSVYLGTHVTRGSATALVTAVGEKTEFGRIAELTAETKASRTPLQLELELLSKTLALIFIGLSTLLLVVGLFQHRAFAEMLRVAVAVSVAAIPEGLLVGMTVILVLGMKRLLASGAYVRRLLAAEALGAVTVICTDKTGTITTGATVVRSITRIDSSWDVGSHHLKTPTWAMRIVEAGVLASHVHWVDHGVSDSLQPQGDAIEVALARAVEQMGVNASALEATPRIDELPFDTAHKLMAVLRDTGKGSVLFLKGAPERVLGLCEFLSSVDGVGALTMERRLQCEQMLHGLLHQGYRVLAIATREVRKRGSGRLLHSNLTGLTLLGFIVFEDPIRKDVPQAVLAAKRAGVRTIMLTGDHAFTAKRAAQESAVASSDAVVIDGAALDQMSDKELSSIIRQDVVFARVEPLQKLRIITAFQNSDEIVAMIGDGINDAPALKMADIGVAIGSGSDVAKDVADLVLLNDSFTTFVGAIREGRVILGNIRKVLLYLLADSFSELILIGAALLAGLPMPLLPLQILWINVVSDGFPYLALTVEAEEPGVMEDRPRAKEEPLLNRDLKIIIIGMAFVTNIGLFTLFAWFSANGVETAALQSIIFAALGLSSLLMVFSCRSIRQPLWSIPMFSNPLLFVAVGLGLAMLVAAVHLPILQQILGTIPLTFADWTLVAIIAVANLCAIELLKGIVRWYPRREERMS